MESQAERLRNAIESTLLSPGALAGEVEKLCLEAVKFGFAGVCVAPCRVALAASLLAGTKVSVVTVAGFPLGFETVAAKAREAEEALLCGASEVDVVMNPAFVLGGEWDRLEEEAAALRGACSGAVLKIILETGRFDVKSLARAAGVCVDCGADYLKTSTGLGPRGATVEDVHFLVRIAGGRASVKAAGGIRTTADALAMLDAGARRIGTSAAAAIMEGALQAL